MSYHPVGFHLLSAAGPASISTYMKPKSTDGNDTRETRRLATLLEVSQALSGTLNLKSALHRVLEILGQASRRGPEHRHVARRGRRAVPSKRPTVSTSRRRASATGSAKASPAGWSRAASRWSCRASAASRISCTGPRGGRAVREELSFVCVPILINRKAVGALGVDLRFKAERDFDSSVKFMGVVASMIAQALKVQRAVEDERRRLLAENTHLRQELRERYDFSNIIGTSGPVREMYEQIAQVAKTNTTVLHPRRIGNRQGADRPRDPLQLAARQEAVREGELRRAAREPDRVRAVRLRERARSPARSTQEGPLRDGRGRHAVSRRDRRRQPGHPGEAAAGPAGARVRAARRHRDGQGRTSA